MIVIPMAGLSRRFKNAGYDLPKYMLKAHGKSLFNHSLGSFKNYFNKEPFLFIALAEHNTKKFIIQESKLLGLDRYQIVVLDKPTQGQAETVYKGLQYANIDAKEPIMIFNIDTFRPNFKLPIEFDIKNVDGYLETFIGSGENWSNILPANEELKTVAFTAEKKQISKYCCTGLYYWKKTEDFCRIIESYLKQEVTEIETGEFFIAPMYNKMIAEGKDIRYVIIDHNEVIFCGTPDEYLNFIGS